MKRLSLALALIAALAAGTAAADVAGPKLHITKLEQLKKPLPKPYDEKATPAQIDKQIDTALARAKAGNKRVILDLGGNWCVWCRSLAAVMELPEAKPFIEKNFEVVPINVSSAKGMTDRNNQVLKRFGIPKVDGFPWLVVLDANGKVLHSSYEVTDKQHEKPQEMINWIAGWAPPKAVRS